jgi:hypothetical protein
MAGGGGRRRGPDARRLPAMPLTSQRTPPLAALRAALLAPLLAVACDRPPAARPAVDSTIPAPAPPPVDSAPAPAPTTTWDAEAGLALVVPGEQGDARVVVPGTGATAPVDTASGAAEAALPNEVLLLSRAGVAGRARATPVPGAPGGACANFPAARLGVASGADAVPAWTVGLVQPAGGPSVTALPLDSLHGLASGDSATLAAGVTRWHRRSPPRGRRGRCAGCRSWCAPPAASAPTRARWPSSPCSRARWRRKPSRWRVHPARRRAAGGGHGERGGALVAGLPRARRRPRGGTAGRRGAGGAPARVPGAAGGGGGARRGGGEPLLAARARRAPGGGRCAGRAWRAAAAERARRASRGSRTAGSTGRDDRAPVTHSPRLPATR